MKLKNLTDTVIQVDIYSIHNDVDLWGSVLRERIFSLFSHSHFPWEWEWEFPFGLWEWEHGNGNEVKNRRSHISFYLISIYMKIFLYNSCLFSITILIHIQLTEK